MDTYRVSGVSHSSWWYNKYVQEIKSYCAPLLLVDSPMWFWEYSLQPNIFLYTLTATVVESIHYEGVLVPEKIYRLRR